MCTVAEAKRITDLVDRRKRAEEALSNLASFSSTIYLKTIDNHWASWRFSLNHTFRTKDIRLALENELKEIKEELNSMGINE